MIFIYIKKATFIGIYFSRNNTLFSLATAKHFKLGNITSLSSHQINNINK